MAEALEMEYHLKVSVANRDFGEMCCCTPATRHIVFDLGLLQNMATLVQETSAVSSPVACKCQAS